MMEVFKMKNITAVNDATISTQKH